MGTAVILGCGYTGRVLAKRLLDAGRRVRGTTTRDAGRGAIVATGAESAVARLDDRKTLEPALHDADVVFHLAPPPRDGSLSAEMGALQAALPSTVQRFVYGSTTGAFGDHDGNPWIDEDTPVGRLGPRGQRRLDYERALDGVVSDLRVVRIAGIYGPDRTILRALLRPGFVLFEGGPPTSRTHVDDLADLLAAMAGPDAPPLAIACDEAPTPTLDVARYACGLLGLELPAPLTLEAARAEMSEAAVEMRMSGRRCRSKVRPALVGALRYPTYETGIVASLRAEGVLAGE